MAENNMSIDQQQVLPEPREALRIMLLGKSGAGKSSSGNTILGREVFKADMKLKRVTMQCEKASGTINNTPVDVIDTPGFFETDRDKEEAVRDILRGVKLQQGGPHAFVHVIPLGRLTQEDQDTHKLIEARFGERVWDYTIVLFTHGDCLEGKTINDVITESDESLRSFLRKCSGGFHVFNNKNAQDSTQVEVLLSKIQTLLALNGGGHYQTALYPRKERSIRERQENILAERENEIGREERNLRERHQGEELERKIRQLWSKEEKNARQKAESAATNWQISVFLLFAFGVLAVCVSLGLVAADRVYEATIAVAVGLASLCVFWYKFGFSWSVFIQRA